MKALVETKLGEQQVVSSNALACTDDQVIKCMDMSGCSAEYTEKVIAAAVPNKTMSLYHRLRQLKDLEMAAIEGLETCPFCPFAAVIENEHEKLFRCQNEECKKVTCRKCKRLVSYVTPLASQLTFRTTFQSAARKPKRTQS